MRRTLSIMLIFCACRGGVSTKDVISTPPDSFVGKVQLLEERCCPPGCGLFAWATAQKFVVLEADSESLIGNEIIIVERCPELKGKGFFKKGKFYKVVASNQYDSTYLIANEYDKKTSFLYWSDEITLIQ